jgi:RNA polymerase sigma factor (sigma-70 family)
MTKEQMRQVNRAFDMCLTKWTTLNRQDRDDARSAAWVVLLSRMADWQTDLGASFSTFAYICADSACRDYYRKFYKPRLGPNTDRQLRVAQYNQSVNNQVTHATQHETLQLKEVLDDLPKDKRKIVDMYLAGYTLKEIGERRAHKVTESRAAQILTGIINDIKGKYELE